VLVETFPGNPSDPVDDGRAALLASLHRARDSGRPDTMEPQRYDVDDGAGFTERYWSVVNVPLLDGNGRTGLLLHRPEEITGYVLQQDVRSEPGRYARAQDLLVAWEQERATRRRLTALTRRSAAALPGADRRGPDCGRDQAWTGGARCGQRGGRGPRR
jgi:hypothetical protein